MRGSRHRAPKNARLSTGYGAAASQELRSLRQRGAYPRHRQFRRAGHEFIGQTQDAKSLAAKPGLACGVGRLSFLAIMARAIDFDDEAAPKADEIHKEASQRDLSLKFFPFASPIANRAPNQRLGLNGVRALLARETTHDRAGDLLWRRANIYRRRNVASRRAVGRRKTPVYRQAMARPPSSDAR